MGKINLIETFLEFKEVKNIDRPTLMSILKDVFVTAIAKQLGSSDNFDVIVNVDKGDLEIWRNRIVVANKDFKDKITEIPLSEARKIDSDYEIGEEVSEELELSDFERRTILTIRQTLAQRIADIEKNEIYYKFQNRVGELIIGEVHQVWKKEILILDDDGHELILPKQEQIPGDHYRKGDTIRAVIIKVEIKGSRPLILLSRTSSVFLERLFELEVPEIFDGLITIKKIVRVHGERAKVAVESYDDRIDPVGACVGMKGSRIHSIVRELRNENIDVINYTTNPKLYITRALSPAKINNIKINEENKHADVTLSADQVSLAIGKGGFNIKLASQLTGYEIDVYRDGEDIEEDVSLDEFSDEIDTWIIDQLKSIGCDTAKSVLRLSPEDLEKRTDLEEETIQEVIEILKSEFE